MRRTWGCRARRHHPPWDSGSRAGAAPGSRTQGSPAGSLVQPRPPLIEQHVLARDLGERSHRTDDPQRRVDQPGPGLSASPSCRRTPPVHPARPGWGSGRRAPPHIGLAESNSPEHVTPPRRPHAARLPPSGRPGPARSAAHRAEARDAPVGAGREQDIVLRASDVQTEAGSTPGSGSRRTTRSPSRSKRRPLDPWGSGDRSGVDVAVELLAKGAPGSRGPATSTASRAASSWVTAPKVASMASPALRRCRTRHSSKNGPWSGASPRTRFTMRASRG